MYSKGTDGGPKPVYRRGRAIKYISALERERAITSETNYLPRTYHYLPENQMGEVDFATMKAIKDAATQFIHVQYIDKDNGEVVESHSVVNDESGQETAKAWQDFGRSLPGTAVRTILIDYERGVENVNET
jgi:hypothetical protein